MEDTKEKRGKVKKITKEAIAKAHSKEELKKGNHAT